MCFYSMEILCSVLAALPVGVDGTCAVNYFLGL